MAGKMTVIPPKKCLVAERKKSGGICKSFKRQGCNAALVIGSGKLLQQLHSKTQ